MTDFDRARRDFPILSTRIYGYPLIYLDNGATTQLPQCVLDCLREHYEKNNANVHRGIHFLSERSTAAFEAARESAARFLGGANSREIIFTSGATEAVNLVARSFQERFLGPGDQVVVTEMEHHSNLIPWQQACQRSGAALNIIPLTSTGELDLKAFYAMLSPRTKLVAVTAVSNVLGTVNPLEDIIRAAHRVGAAVLVDAAQALRHIPIRVRELNCDFLCFSGHKLMGPAGIGVLYGKEEWLSQMPPVSFGGGMATEVSPLQAEFESLPQRLEAGTPNYPAAIGLAAALDYLSSLGREEIARREEALLEAYEDMLRQIPAVKILGAPARRAGVISFAVSGASSFDVAALLDKLGVAVRSGRHCAAPLMARFGISGAVRLSPAFYNEFEEIPLVRSALERVCSVLEVRG